MKLRPAFPFLVVALFATPALSQNLPLSVAELDRTEPVDFQSEILPLLKQNCLACHHEKEAEGGLILETLESMTKGGDSGHGIVPGKVDDSLLFTRAVGLEEPLMPPEDNSVGANPLTPEQLGLIKRWIEEGAKVGKSAMKESIQWQPIPESIRTVNSLDVSPAGRFAVVGRGNRVVVIDLATHQVTHRLVDESLALGAVTDVDLIQSVAVSPEGDQIATGGFRTVRLWRRTPRAVEAIDTPMKNVSGAVAVHPNQSKAALVNAIGDIEVWDLSDGTLLATLPAGLERTNHLCWSNEPERLLTADEMGGIRLWNVGDAKQLAAADARSPLKSLSLSADVKWIVCADSSGKAHLFGVSDDQTKIESKVDGVGGLTDVTAVTLVTNPSPMAVVASGEGAISLVDATNNQVVRKFEHGAPVHVLKAVDDQSQLLTGGEDGRTQRWNLADGKSLVVMSGDRRGRLRLESATRDAERQKASVERLTQKTDTLKKLLEKENEALKKVTEEHQKATEALTAETKKHADAVALVTATQAKINKASAETAEATKVIEASKAALATAQATADELAKSAVSKKAELTQAQSRVVTAVNAAEAAVKAMEEAKALAAQMQQQLDAVNAKAKQATETIAIEQKKIDESNIIITDAKKVSDEAAKQLEAQQKEVKAAEDSKVKSEQTLAKRQQALNTATAAQQRATAAIPKHESFVKAESTRKGLLEQRVTQAQQQLSDKGSTVVDLVLTDSGVVFASHQDGTVAAYQNSDGKPVDVFTAATRQPHRIAVVGEALFAFANDDSFHQWSTKSDWVLEGIIGAIDDPEVISDRVTAIDFHRDGNSIAVGSGPPSRSGEVKIFDVRTGRKIRDFGEVHSDTVLGLAFSPDGRLLASSAADKTIRLLDVARASEVRSLEGHTHHVLSISWQDDGQTLASASADQTVKIWNVETGEQRRTITGFRKEITSVAFVQTSNQIMAACADGQVRLYDSGNGKSLRSFEASGDFLYTLSVTPDGNELMAAGQSGKVRFWTVKDAKLVHELD